MSKQWLSWSGVDSKLIRMSSRLIVPSVRKLNGWIGYLWSIVVVPADLAAMRA